jgi:hypothetical protein
VPSHLVGHLRRQPGAGVVHGEDDAKDVEARVEHAAHQAERVAELGEAFESVVLALDRDQDGVGGGEAVHREEPKRGRAVEQDEIVFTGGGPKGAPQTCLPCKLADQLDLGPGEVNSRGDRGHAGDAGADARIGQRDAVAQAIVRRHGVRRSVHADAARGVALGIHVNEEDLAIERGEAGAEVDGGGRLADATLLIHYCDDEAHSVRNLARFGHSRRTRRLCQVIRERNCT